MNSSPHPSKILKMKCDDTEVVRAALEHGQGQSLWHQHGMVQPQCHHCSVSLHTLTCIVLDPKLLSSEQGVHGAPEKNSIQEVQKLC